MKFFVRLMALGLLFNAHCQSGGGVRIPVESANRHNIESIRLTEIGSFGLPRKARPNVPAHLHTGIDIQRPIDDYHINQPIYSIANGRVISKRDDGPFAQLIIEHQFDNLTFWSVYEHVADISVELFEPVTSNTPIARFFNLEELDKYGWQFDHFHFEIVKKRPLEIRPNPNTPERRFSSYSLSCYDLLTLDEHFYNPIEFLRSNRD